MHTSPCPDPETRRTPEFIFTEEDFNYLRSFTRTHTGIKLSDTKQDLVYRRLVQRLRQLGFSDFRQYCQHLENNTELELEQFVNAITTNTTAFFRERHHFDYLNEFLLSELSSKCKSKRRLRIWSAGCSSGEEPYSIAITIKELIPDLHAWDIKILATDIDSGALAKARSGIYSQENVEGLSPSYLKRWFMKGRGKRQGLARIVPELQEIISFRSLNLLGPWPMRGPFDIIFCRNVIIYFGKTTKQQIINRFSDLQKSGSHLFLGHSESLIHFTERYRLIGKTIYKRVE